MNVAVMKRNILPLLSMDEAVLLCITTISDQPANFFDQLINLPGPVYNEGDTMPRQFKQYNFSPVCAACRAQGITLQCDHGRRRLPKWQSARKLKLVKALMSMAEDDTEREILGTKATKGPECFPELRVRELFAAPPVSFIQLRDVTHVYICIDPNSGTHDASTKTSSDFAVVSAYEGDGGRLTICGLESIDAHGHEDYVDKVVRHLHRLRGRAAFRDAKFIFAMENNLGSEASRLKEDVMVKAGITNCVFMRDTELKAGVRTSSLIKRDMAVELRSKLLKGQIGFDSHLVTSSEDVPGLLNELQRQMLAYSQVKNIPNSMLTGEVRVKWTGKLSAGMKDDMVVALQLLIYWMIDFWKNGKYSAYW